MVPLLQASISGAIVDVHPGKPMLVAFGGLSGAETIPRFEFAGISEGFGVSCVLIRDLRQVWYKQGVLEFGDTMAVMAERLKELARRANAPRVVCIGASAGGFAASTVGAIAEFDEVHAFAPQTDLRLLSRCLRGDFRWKRQVLQTYLVPGCFPSRDLPRIIQASSDCSFTFHTGICGPDARAVARLRLLPRVRLIEHAVVGHGFVRELRSSGVLQQIIQEALFREAKIERTIS